MSNDIQVANGNNALRQMENIPQPIQTSLNQHGDNNTQIAYVEKMHQTVVVLAGSASAGVQPFSQNVSFDYDCYNLFVIGSEQYADGFFIVPKDRALTESTSQEIKERCATLSPEAIGIIKTFPALFCSENHHYTKTDDDHIAYYGYITDIKIQDNGVKIYFRILNNLPQQLLINLSEELCIGRASSYTELCRTHWAIKRVNLVETLEKFGVKVFKL